MNGALIKGRIRALYNGSAVLSAVLDGDGNWVAEPELSTIGVLEDNENAIAEDAITAARNALKDLSASKRRDDDVAREAMRIAVRRCFRKTLDKKPQTTVHLIRIQNP